jgi:ubiquinone/menaquinone biosynthesis C-methylase UbiE
MGVGQVIISLQSILIIFKMINLPQNATILEIGSGHNPHPQSTVLCDRFLTNQHRSNFNFTFDRPMVIADGSKLPFKNDSFDFVFCQQVIEHVKNPKQFAQELSRVGKAGLIITPHAIRERLFGWPKHLWFIQNINNKLVFHHKPKNYQNPYSTFFHQHFHNSLSFRRFCFDHEKDLNVYHYWQKKIDLSVTKNINFKFIDQSLEKLLATYQLNYLLDQKFEFKQLNQRLKNKIAKKTRKSKWQNQLKQNPDLNIDLLKKYLACPRCHSDLQYNQKNITCISCLKKYHLKTQLPVFVRI